MVVIRCKNCGADFKTKYIIHLITKDKTITKTNYEATSRKSIVGWIKHIVDNFSFEEIEIRNLLVMCHSHEEYYKHKSKEGNKHGKV